MTCKDRCGLFTRHTKEWVCHLPHSLPCTVAFLETWWKISKALLKGCTTESSAAPPWSDSLNSRCTNMPKNNNKKNKMESENTAYSSCNEDSRAGQGAEEKCVSPPWGVNLSSLLDPWKQTNTAFSRLSKKRVKRGDFYSKWQPWRRMFINIVEQTGRRTLQSSHLITQCLWCVCCVCVCVCVFEQD